MPDGGPDAAAASVLDPPRSDPASRARVRAFGAPHPRGARLAPGGCDVMSIADVTAIPIRGTFSPVFGRLATVRSR
jgi:hypothetical protein